MSQVISSAKTSIKQVPAIAKKDYFLDSLKSAQCALNYGCGEFPILVDRHCNHNFFKYDPFHDYNELKDFYAFDVILCANVLNVIDSRYTMTDIVWSIFNHLERGGKAFFSVYEGNRSGDGKVTKKGYQRNQKSGDYLELLSHVFGAQNVTKKGNEFICTKLVDSKAKYL